MDFGWLWEVEWLLPSLWRTVGSSRTRRHACGTSICSGWICTGEGRGCTLWLPATWAEMDNNHHAKTAQYWRYREFVRVKRERWHITINRSNSGLSGNLGCRRLQTCSSSSSSTSFSSWRLQRRGRTGRCWTRRRRLPRAHCRSSWGWYTGSMDEHSIAASGCCNYMHCSTLMY